MHFERRRGPVSCAIATQPPAQCKDAVPANQRAGTARLAESGYLRNGRRAGQASSGGWDAWGLLLALIKVAPELAVELLA